MVLKLSRTKSACRASYIGYRGSSRKRRQLPDNRKRSLRLWKLVGNEFKHYLLNREPRKFQEMTESTIMLPPHDSGNMRSEEQCLLRFCMRSVSIHTDASTKTSH